MEIQQGRESPLVGGRKADLFELAWLVSYSIVTNHYLFQCPKAIFCSLNNVRVLVSLLLLIT